MSDEDISLDEKRVYDERRDTARVFVASALGLARVAVSDDQIGRFGLIHRGETRDVAVGENEGGRIAAATPDDVLVGAVDDADDGETLRATEFGPAVAVSFADRLVAAAPDGRIARHDGDDWTALETVEPPVSAADGDLFATADGVVRVANDHLVALGCDDARDVAAAGPFAATGNGLFRFADGEWVREAADEATAVASDGRRSIAVVDGAVRERADDETWTSADCPAEVVDVAALTAAYAITGDGTLLVDPAAAKDGATGWASRSLGLPDVAGLAVAGATTDARRATPDPGANR